MRRAAAGALAIAAAAGLAAAGCTSAPLALPQEVADRAATCGAVRTLELREGKVGGGPLSFAGFTEVSHFAMLAAIENRVQVDLQRLALVAQRTPALVAQLENENWPSLIEPCNASFPETHKSGDAVPTDAYEAGMICFSLADLFARTASGYPAEQRELAALADRGLRSAQPVLRQRARSNDEAQRIAGGYAARAFKAGRPDRVLAQCRRRFPAARSLGEAGLALSGRRS